MRVRAISRDRLVAELAGRLLAVTGSRQRVLVDGAEALRPGEWAMQIAETVRDRGRYALAVSTDDFLLPASQRFEFGRRSPDAFYEGWRDEASLAREVLDPAAPGGSGRVLPALWRSDIDRSARADYVTLPPDGMVVVGGQFLLAAVTLGRFEAELSIHLTATPRAIERHTPPDRAWTLPAYERYAADFAPETLADVVVRLEDPRRPALIEPD